jgi:hypothetical protein
MSKFRLTASWEVNNDSQEQLEEIKQKIGVSDINFRFEKIKEKVLKIRIGEFSFDDVFPYITKKESKRDYEVDGVKYSVKMNSQRYFLFRQCPKCVACGLVGTKIFLEEDSIDPHPHFNLYGEEDDRLILLTKDHIHAKSCGGEDNHSNYQTMCAICNNIKGNANLTLAGIRQLRLLYNENKHLTKKKLSALIGEAKYQLSKPWHEPVKYKKKKSSDALVTINDINIFLINHELFAKAAYDEIHEGLQVACLRRGTVLEPLMSLNSQLLCQLSDKEVFFVPQNLVRSVGK